MVIFLLALESRRTSSSAAEKERKMAVNRREGKGREGLIVDTTGRAVGEQTNSYKWTGFCNHLSRHHVSLFMMNF